MVDRIGLDESVLLVLVAATSAHLVWRRGCGPWNNDAWARLERRSVIVVRRAVW